MPIVSKSVLEQLGPVSQKSTLCRHSVDSG